MYLVKLHLDNLPPLLRRSFGIRYIEIPEIRHFWFFKIPKTKKWLYFRLVDRHKKLEEVKEAQAHSKSVSLKSRVNKAPKLNKRLHQQATYEFSPRREPDFKFENPVSQDGHYSEDHQDVQTFFLWHYEKFNHFPK